MLQVCEMVSTISSDPCGVLTNIVDAEAFNFSLPFPEDLVDLLEPAISEVIDGLWNYVAMESLGWDEEIGL